MSLLVGQNSPTSGGSGHGSGGNSKVYWVAFTSGPGGVANALEIALISLVAVSMNIGLYDASGNLIVAANAVGSLVLGVNSASISNTTILASTVYNLAWQFNTTQGVADDGTTFKGTAGTNTFANGMPSVLPTGTNQNIGTPTIWADGTPSGGGGGGGGSQGMGIQYSPGGTPTITHFSARGRRRRVFYGLGLRDRAA